MSLSCELMPESFNDLSASLYFDVMVGNVALKELFRVIIATRPSSLQQRFNGV